MRCRDLRMRRIQLLQWPGRLLLTACSPDPKFEEAAIIMDITQVGVVMLFGALVAAAGLAFLFFGTDQGENVIRIWRQEFRVSRPALGVCPSIQLWTSDLG